MSQTRIPIFWAAALALVMGGLFLVSAGSFVAALRHPATVVDADYYTHGLGYGREGAEAPWRLDARVTGETVAVTVLDTAGAPVTGGTVTCRPAGERGRTIPFTESGPGIYTVPRRLLPRGDLHATVRCTRGSSHSTRRMVIFQ